MSWASTAPAARCSSGASRSWLRWYAKNLWILAKVLVGGLLLVVPAVAVGWGTTEDVGLYLFLWLYLPFTGTLYLLALALIGRSVARPRVWAFLLTPVFWGAVPIFALGVATPAISATWVALLLYAHLLVLPPPRRRSEP